MRTVTIYVASALAIWFAIRFVNHIERYEQLSSSGVQVVGKVVSTTCGNHGSFVYEYTAHGNQISASGRSSLGGLNCHELSPGISVPVSYLVNSPTESVAGSAVEALSEQRRFAVASSLFLPALVLWFRHRKQAQGRVA